MAQEKKIDTKPHQKVEERKKVIDKRRDRRNKSDELTKVVVRRLPPTWTKDALLEQLSPIAEHDYFHFARADLSLGQYAFSRVYINFLHQEDIIIFKEKFDGYIFLDSKGNEFSAVVEFAPFPKTPKRRSKKPDSRCDSIEQDGDYQTFVDSLQNPKIEPAPAPEIILEEIEAREKELKANNGLPRLATPLISYIRKKREDKKAAILRAREDRKKREIDRRKQREDEKRKRREKERLRQRELERQRQYEKKEDKKRDTQTPTKVVLLKKPERDVERKESGFGNSSYRPRDKDGSRSGSANESREKEARGDTKIKDDNSIVGGSKGKDLGSKVKVNEGERPKDRGYKGRSKPSPRESKWKDWDDRDREKDRSLGRDRNRDRDKPRDTGNFGGYNKRVFEPERPKSRSGKYDEPKSCGFDPTSNDKYSDKSTERSMPGLKDTNKEHTQSYLKRREEYHDQKSGKNSQGDKTDKIEGESEPSKDNSVKTEPDTDNNQHCSVTEKSSETESRSDDVGMRDDGDSRVQVEEAGDIDDREDSGRDAKGRKMRYRDRPERAIYNPAHRAAQRRKEMEARSRSKDSPESSLSPEAGGDND